MKKVMVGIAVVAFAGSLAIAGTQIANQPQEPALFKQDAKGFAKPDTLKPEPKKDTTKKEPGKRK